MTDQEINEAVARKLGWDGTPEGGVLEFWKYGHLKDYCHSIEAAWEIVEKIAKTDFPMIVYKDLDSGWGCNVKGVEVWADTAPMAICKAFLKLP